MIDVFTGTVVVERDADDRFGGRHQQTRVASLLRIASQIAHLTVKSARQPLAQTLSLFGQSSDWNNTNFVKSERVSLMFNIL
jgi:hypothetical protein